MIGIGAALVLMIIIIISVKCYKKNNNEAYNEINAWKYYLNKNIYLYLMFIF